MHIPPFPSNLAESAAVLGITAVWLNWSGGSDQGYLDLRLHPDLATRDCARLADRIEQWADAAFDYNGAGDGNDYGDDFAYDLVNKTVTHSQWSMVRQEDGCREVPLEIEPPPRVILLPPNPEGAA